jgi:polysaccharide pyruvyl transferase WcaK-like protein
VRILVDQSGYDLLNIGDVAMLQACLSRLRMHWPDAEIMVIAHEPARLASYCPEARAITRPLAGHPLLRCLPRKPLLASEQAWKIAGPYMRGRVTSGRAAGDRPGTAIQAVQAADLVVASGGGYLTDSWWWHAAGVLSLLSLAQRLGKPTAMFGQGVGPISRPWLRAQAGTVLPKLKVLGLREDRMGRDLALSLGAPAAAVTLTGDDALELVDGATPVAGRALGLSVRVAGYAGVASGTAAAVGAVVAGVARELGAPVSGLPVSRYPADADLAVLRTVLPGGPGRGPVRADCELEDIRSPAALVAAAGGCRAIVTGSYHAAVFGAAQGVPVVCLTGSPYYEGKFSGLRALFPGTCSVVPLGPPGYPARLIAAIHHAWCLPDAARAAAREAAARLRDAGRAAYAQFRAEAERSAAVTA